MIVLILHGKKPVKMLLETLDVEAIWEVVNGNGKIRDSRGTDLQGAWAEGRAEADHGAACLPPDPLYLGLVPVTPPLAGSAGWNCNV